MEDLGLLMSFLLSLYPLVKMVLHSIPLPARFSMLTLAYFDCLRNPGPQAGKAHWDEDRGREEFVITYSQRWTHGLGGHEACTFGRRA